VQFSRRFLFTRTMRRQYPEQCRLLLLSSSPETLSRTAGRIAEITNSASRLTIGKITKVTDQSRHTALVRVGETEHLFNLRAFVPRGNVEFAPLALPDDYVLGGIQHGAAVDPQLFEGLVERVGIHPHLFLQRGLFHRLPPQPGERDVGIQEIYSLAWNSR
jgi:hypothetical protein